MSDYPITNQFNPPSEPGRDYGTPLGTPLYAPVSGTAIVNDTGSSGWGKSVQIKTYLGGIVGAGHLSSINVKNGQSISAGQKIGETGTSGNSSGPHVELFFKDLSGNWINPSQNEALITAFFTPTAGSIFGTGVPAPGASTGPCMTFKLTLLGNDICFDPFVGMLAIVGGGVLLLGGIAVLVAFALKDTGAGRTASRAVGYMGGPVGAAVEYQSRQREANVRVARDTEADRQAQAATAHQEAIRRSQLRISRARARTAEGRAKAVRDGSSKDVASSASRKAASGKFSDFNESEVQWAEQNPDALRAAIKGSSN